MWKKRKNRKSFYLILFLGMILVLLNSCENKKCTENIIDKRTLNEYYVQIDTCNKFKGFSHHKYFKNSGLFMSGYSDRLLKQGEWSYFKENEEIAKGKFKDGQPVGTWYSKYFKKIKWKDINNDKNGFRISIPSSWYINSDISNFVLFTSSDSINKMKANLNIVISDYDLKISEYINKNTDTLRKNFSIKEIELKELNIDDISESFQRKFKIEKNGYKTLTFQTFYGRKDLGKVFIITINSKYNLYDKYEAIFESMLSSFKMY